MRNSEKKKGGRVSSCCFLLEKHWSRALSRRRERRNFHHFGLVKLMTNFFLLPRRFPQLFPRVLQFGRFIQRVFGS
jgi:hypothetical protein